MYCHFCRVTFLIIPTTYTSEDISPNLYICILYYRPLSSLASIHFLDKTFENYFMVPRSSD